MPILFEYQTGGQAASPQLGALLQNIWESRRDAGDGKQQRLLELHKGKTKALNYVGFVQDGAQLLEIYPKVFAAHYPAPDAAQKTTMLRHFFYWLDHCGRWRFPFHDAQLEGAPTERLPELVIYLIAQQFRQAIEQQPLAMYQRVEEAGQQPKGRINFSRYTRSQLSKGNFHVLEYDYEPFVFDNTLNRAIKYCARLLLSQTTQPANALALQEVVFLLDEVEDCAVRVEELDGIRLHAFFELYEGVRDSCRIVLQQQIYSHAEYDFSHWALLLPMERIFEDFVAGFLRKHFSDRYEITPQNTGVYLCDNTTEFRLRPDLIATSRQSPEKKILLDTKYKLLVKNKNERPKIAQADMYQMLAYAHRYGCEKIVLLYPNSQKEAQFNKKYTISSEFPDVPAVEIHAIEIPFWIDGDDMQALETKLLSAFEEIFKQIFLNEK